MSEVGVKNIGPYALGLMIAIVLVAIGAYVLSVMAPTTYLATAVLNEAHNSSATVPETVTLTYCINGLVGTPTVVQLDNATGTQYALTATTNYTVLSSTACTLNITSAGRVNSTGDRYTVNYTYNADTNATYVLNSGLNAFSTFADWFTIMVIVLVAIVIIGVVMLLGRQGGRE